MAIIDNPNGQGYYCIRCGTLYGHFENIRLECYRGNCKRVKSEDLPKPIRGYREEDESITEGSTSGG